MEKDEREGAGFSIHVLIGARDTAGVDNGTIGAVEGFVGEDDVFFGEDDIGRFDFASDGRYAPVIECCFPTDVFLAVIAHARILTKGVE